MRHKRQALQDMARPLKQWLYKHRDNPYPTKTEKILLALGSQMTLVQVIQTPQTGIFPPRQQLRSRNAVLLRLCLSLGRVVTRRAQIPWFLFRRRMRARHRCQVLL